MELLGKDLEFISLIKRDGSGTIPVGTPWDASKDYAKTDDTVYLDSERFYISCLSLSEKTHIANGMNSWIVKIREQPKVPLAEVNQQYFDTVQINTALGGQRRELVVMHQCGSNKGYLIDQLKTMIHGIETDFKYFAG